MTDPTTDNTITPLPNTQKIVNSDGTPTTFFIRWAQERSIDISNGVTAAQVQQLIDEWGAAHSITAGTGLSGGGTLESNPTINLSDTAVTPSTYGDGTHVPQITVDQQGRITDVVDVAISGGGGGGGDFTLLQEIILTANAATVTFASIDQTHRDLVLIMSSTGTVTGSGGDEFINALFNSDTGSNYNYARWSRFESDTGFNQSPGNIAANISFDTAGETWPSHVEIFQYASSTINKHWQTRTSLFGGGNLAVRFIDGWWANHAPLTQIDLSMAGQSFLAGSKFQLYGRG